MPASIELDFALNGSHIPQAGFTASGTYVGDGGMPNIIATLVRGASAPITAAGAPLADGSWTAPFAAILPGGPYTLTAEIEDGTSDSESQVDLTVDNDPPIVMLPLIPIPLPTPTPPPVGGGGGGGGVGVAALARVDYDVAGTHKGVVKHLLVAAVVFSGVGNANKIDAIDAVAVGTINSPAAGQWKARLSVTSPLAANKKIGVAVIAFNDKGKVVGRVFRRRKPS